MKIALARVHPWSITGHMERGTVKLSPVSQSVIWKRVSKTTNSPYERLYISLLAFHGAQKQIPAISKTNNQSAFTP
jgi:hypothetical protein